MSGLPPPFTLTEGEKHSPLWARLLDEFSKMLAQKRGKNDGALDPLQTATLRGEINLLKAIIRLGEDPPPHDG